jgi:hypothetical protein
MGLPIAVRMGASHLSVPRTGSSRTGHRPLRMLTVLPQPTRSWVQDDGPGAGIAIGDSGRPPGPALAQPRPRGRALRGEGERCRRSRNPSCGLARRDPSGAPLPRRRPGSPDRRARRNLPQLLPAERGSVTVLVARTLVIGDQVRGLGTGGFQGGRCRSGGQARPVIAPLDPVGSNARTALPSFGR